MSSQNGITNMAILTIGFDGYSDLWDDFFFLLNENWSDRKHRTVLSNNELNKDYENVEIINCGKDAEWSKKVRDAVSSIPEKYICLLLEDFYIGDPVDNQLIDETLEYIEKQSIKYYKLKNFTKVNTELYDNKLYLKTIPKNLEYGISLQPAIWERDYLLELLGEGNYNAWKFESSRIDASIKSNKENLEGCVFDNRNILNIQHGVIQGKYIPTTVDYFKKKGYCLNTSQRRVMTSREYLIIRIKAGSKDIFPKKFYKYIKKFMKLFGMKFISDVHK